jgi:hypothetical protein
MGYVVVSQNSVILQNTKNNLLLIFYLNPNSVGRAPKTLYRKCEIQAHATRMIQRDILVQE